MPATFAHPVFAVPLRRFGLPTSALVLGAMAPDVAYVLPFWHPLMGHSLPGIFTFGLPVGLLGWFVFQRWVKPGLFVAAPRPLQVAFQRFDGRPEWRSGRTWALAALAAGVAAATHIGIDGFTHSHGWAISTWPEIFGAPLLPSPLGVLPLYKTLQYGLGIGGAAVLGWWIWQAYRAGPRAAWTGEDLRRARRLAVIFAALCLVGAAHGSLAAFHEDGVRQVKVLVVQTVAATLVLFGGAAIGWGLFYPRSRSD